MDTTIICDKCEKKYKNTLTFTNHIKLNRCKIKDTSVICNKCNKGFYNRDSRIRHEKKCMVMKLPTSENSIDELKDIIIDMKNTIQDLIKDKIEPTHITNNNTQNIQNNIHLTLNYGEENMNHITIKDIIFFLEQGESSIEALVEYKHFNRQVPENCNVVIKNLNNKFALMYKNSKWEVVNKSYILQDLYTSNVTYLKGKFEEIKSNLPKKIMNKFQKFIELSRNVDIIEPILDNIRCILYNNRDLVVELNKIKNTKGEEVLMISSDEFNIQNE
jgi:hypothetical protein